MNVIDQLVAWVHPMAGLRRVQARRALAQYEGAKKSRYRRRQDDNTSPNALVSGGAAVLRAHARALERDHDLSRGALRVLVNNVVGPSGIGIEPQPRKLDGTIHTDYAEQLREAYRDWQKKPEVTWKLRWPLAQRMMAYTWLRDGEVFAQELIGPVPFLDHGTRVPYSLEIFEPDFVPLDYDDPARNIRQGIRSDSWGRAREFFVFKGDPRESALWLQASDLKSISADRMLHLATFDRLHQQRGVSEFASVITRIEDLKDYEESERIAAKVAASLTAYVKRNGETSLPPDASAEADTAPRDLRLQPGMIIDTLLAGEEIGLINSGDRPNPNLVTWRSGQLRAYAAGIGASHSSVSREYTGTYSGQRQELVEQWVHYAVLTDEFAGAISQPVYSHFVMAAHLSGVVPMPPDLKPGTQDDCLFIGQSMPWIDPAKETAAWLAQVQAGFASEVEVIRRRGANPRDILEQVATWREQTRARGVVFNSDVAATASMQQAAAAAAQQPTADPKEDPAAQDDTSQS